MLTEKLKMMSRSFFAIVILLFTITVKSQTLQEVGSSMQSAPSKAVIYVAKEIITMDPKNTTAEAVAVLNDKILSVGKLSDVKLALGATPYEVDNRFAKKVLVPGFIAQHDHPILAALTLASEVLSIEDWVLPSGTVPAVKSKEDFMTRLSAAEKKLTDPEEALVTWGYHPSFYGPLTRADLDKISKTRPVIAWMRSAHELVFNTAAMNKYGINAEFVNGLGESPKRQSNFDEGRFWEQGFFAVGPKIAGVVATPERLTKGLQICRDYMHAKGITYGNEPGGILVKPLQEADFQIHIHVNGDAGLDRVLNTVEENMRRNPRYDHRTVIVHFAVSAKDQVDRIARLGCIVSGNPYYTRALADNYSKNGLGPDRADNMVRMGDVERAGVSYSYHSDMPMAPADPLFLMWCGINRITTGGRVAAPNQKVSRLGALKAVTIDAAYSLKVEGSMGSIERGKLANFTILADNPLTVDPTKVKDIGVWGTVVEGRVQPVQKTVSGEKGKSVAILSDADFSNQAMGHVLAVLSRHEH